MEELLSLIRRINISKVELASYLGVSRQMVYNYLSFASVDDWPKDKKIKLLDLLEVDNFDNIDDITVDSAYLIKIQDKLNSCKKSSSPIKGVDFENLSIKSQETVIDFYKILKDIEQSEDSQLGETCIDILNSSLLKKELKYMLVYFAKLLGKLEPKTYQYNQEDQYALEAILYSAFQLYKSKNYSLSKLELAHRKFEKEINDAAKERAENTQILSVTKTIALRELGYDELTTDNAEEVFSKMAEIQSRHF